MYESGCSGEYLSLPQPLTTEWRTLISKASIIAIVETNVKDVRLIWSS